MQQMPEEGRLFQTVDRNWKDVMKHTVRDPHVSVNLVKLMANSLPVAVYPTFIHGVCVSGYLLQESLYFFNSFFK